LLLKLKLMLEFQFKPTLIINLHQNYFEDTICLTK
jgi:hypothetical protein